MNLFNLRSSANAVGPNDDFGRGAMSRSYKGVFIKKHRVYSGKDLMDLYSVGPNTISNWNGEGLRRSNSAKPYHYQGAAVADFHKQRMERTRIQLRPGEFKCMRCKAAGFP